LTFRIKVETAIAMLSKLSSEFNQAPPKFWQSNLSDIKLSVDENLNSVSISRVPN
jgi:hypothetical protein